MSSPETDAFHLFHLSDLTFDLSSPATLTSAQLCLALFNPDYDKNVHEAKLKRTWRARREKTRPRIGKVPIGNLASEDERNAHPGDRWPGFELCDLSFTVPDEAGLDELESWQLAVLRFHPDSKEDLLEPSIDIFLDRRERDFNHNVDLPPLPPAPSSSSAAAFAPSTSAPKPPSTSAAAPPPLAPTRPPASASTTAPPLPFAFPLPSTASVSTLSARPDPSTAPPQPVKFAFPSVDHGGAPHSVSGASTARTVDKERSRGVAARLEEDDTVDAGRSTAIESTSSAPADVKPVVGTNSPSSRRESGEKDRSSRNGDDVHRSTDRSRDRSREREKAKYPASEERSRGSRSERDRSRSRDRRDRDRERDRDRDGRRRSSRERERESRARSRSPSRKNSSAKSPARNGRDDSDKGSSKPLMDRLGGVDNEGRRRERSVDSVDRRGRRNSLISRDGEYDHSRGGLDQLADERNYGYVHPNEASLLVSGGPTHHNTDIPFELAEALSVVLIHNVPRYSVFEDIRHLLLSLSQIAPAGLKMSFGHGPSQRSRQSGAEVSTCFAAYLVPEDAMEVEKRLKGQRFGGEILSSEMAHPPRFSDGRPKDRMWRWQNFDKHFKELWSRGSIRVARLENGLPALHQRSPSPARNIKRRQSSPLPPYGFAPPAPPPPPSVSKKDPRDDEPVPWVVAQPLFQLFVSNLPEFVRIGEMREFFDDCVGLCGITLGTPNAKFHNCAGWLIFTEKSERDAAQVQLHNQRFPGERAPLYLEKAEPRKTTTHLYWRDMSKEFRSKFRDGPGMPSTNGPATQSSPISPHDHMRGSFSQYPTPASISTPSPAPGSLVPGENPANGPAKNKIHPSRLGLIPEGPRSTTEIDEALASLIPFQPVAAFPPPAPTGTNASPLPTGPRFSHAPKRDSTMVDPPLMSRSPSNEKRAKEDMPIPTGPRSLSIKGFGTKSPTRPPSAPLPPSPSPPKFSLPFKMPEPPKVVASLLSQLGGSLSSGPNGAAEEIVDAQAPSVHKESSEVQNGDVQMEEEEDVKPNIVPESN